MIDATSIPAMITELILVNAPQMGSVYIGTAYSNNGETVPVGWYNYISI